MLFLTGNCDSSFRVRNQEIIRMDENGGSHYDIRQQKTP